MALESTLATATERGWLTALEMGSATALEWEMP
jgi:hypothetical protein